MIKPILYSEIEAALGEPGSRRGLITKRAPFPLRLSWKPVYVRNVLIHERIGAEFVSALEEILEYYGIGFIEENKLDYFGGCYNKRQSRGSGRWSVHSWGMAVDYLPAYGPFASPALTPAPIVAAFKKQGFLWGGDWNLPDGMHYTSVIE